MEEYYNLLSQGSHWITDFLNWVRFTTKINKNWVLFATKMEVNWVRFVTNKIRIFV